MCGIVGYFDPALDQDQGLARLRRMCAAIVHRGPDDEGIFVDGTVGLGCGA